MLARNFAGSAHKYPPFEVPDISPGSKWLEKLRNDAIFCLIYWIREETMVHRLCLQKRFFFEFLKTVKVVLGTRIIKIKIKILF